jgi:hypothetical protein
LYWDNFGERQTLGPKLIQDTREKMRVIKERMSVAQSWQKSYVDNGMRSLEFEVGDRVFLKISPMRGVMQFGKKGKLSPRFAEPFEITQLKEWGGWLIRLPYPQIWSERITFFTCQC